jgi:hypothetical protein
MGGEEWRREERSGPKSAQGTTFTLPHTQVFQCMSRFLAGLNGHAESDVTIELRSKVEPMTSRH